VPGALDHASGEADEFEAALVRGAGGVPVEPDAPAGDYVDASIGSDGNVDTEHLSEGEVEAEALSEGDIGADELQEPAGSPARRAPGGGAGSGVTPEQASGAPIRGGNRALSCAPAGQSFSASSGPIAGRSRRPPPSCSASSPSPAPTSASPISWQRKSSNSFCDARRHPVTPPRSL
jgi:hypothetical protein